MWSRIEVASVSRSELNKETALLTTVKTGCFSKSNSWKTNACRFIDEAIAQLEIFSNNDRLAEILASKRINLSNIIMDREHILLPSDQFG